MDAQAHSSAHPDMNARASTSTRPNAMHAHAHAHAHSSIRVDTAESQGHSSNQSNTINTQVHLSTNSSTRAHGTFFAFIPLLPEGLNTALYSIPQRACQWPGIIFRNTNHNITPPSGLPVVNTENRNVTNLFLTQPHTLLTIPGEIRMNMYHQLFKDSQLDVHLLNMNRIDPNDQFSVYRLLKNVDTSILNTSSFLRNEGLKSLNDHTQLNIFNSFRQSDPLANIPDQFLARIKTIKVEFDGFIHIDRARLPALKLVKLVHEVDGFEPFVDTVDTMFTKGNDIVVDVMEDVLDWRWKCHQFVFVAREEGFTVKLTALWDVYSEGAEARIDVEVNLESNQLVGLRGFIGSREVAVVSRQQAELDWASYGQE